MDDDPRKLRPSDVRARILADHREIEAALVELETLADLDLDGAAGGAQRVRQLRLLLYAKLRAHIDLEDAILAPALRELDAWGEVRAEALLRHHEEQRSWLASLVAAVDEPPPPGAPFGEFVRRIVPVLREDMKHEERDLLHPDLLRDDIVGIDVQAG